MTVYHPIIAMYPDRVVRFGAWDDALDGPRPGLYLDPQHAHPAPVATIHLSWRIEACALIAGRPIRWTGSATRWALMAIDHPPLEGGWEWVPTVLAMVNDAAAKEQAARVRLQSAVDRVNATKL